MKTVEAEQTVGAIVADRPALSRVFERVGIDYCCGGKKTLQQACLDKGLDLPALIAELEQDQLVTDEPLADAASMSLGELADHIEATHHAYLRSELPRLRELTEKVAAAHSSHDPRLSRVKQTLALLASELTSHMLKEEQILFPFIRQLETSAARSLVPGGSIRQPIQQMHQEHQDAGDALSRLRELTDGYSAPPWACNTYRAMLDALSRFERDMHQHVHKEENILFPRAIERAAPSGAKEASV